METNDNKTKVNGSPEFERLMNRMKNKQSATEEKKENFPGSISYRVYKSERRLVSVYAELSLFNEIHDYCLKHHMSYTSFFSDAARLLLHGSVLSGRLDK